MLEDCTFSHNWYKAALSYLPCPISEAVSYVIFILFSKNLKKCKTKRKSFEILAL